MTRENDFSARLGNDPDDVYLDNLRKPEYEMMSNHFFDPLAACNRAQAIALHESGILDTDEVADILDALIEIEARGSAEFRDFEQFEDPYLEMEEFVISRTDDRIGGKLHTGRSRNDLYAAAVRMVTRDKLLQVMAAALDLRNVVLERAEEFEEVVFPAFTHGQPAQPITLGHYLLSFDHLLERDIDRLQSAYETTNVSPLGAAALAGTGFNIDRVRLAELTGFSDVCYNTYDAVASMDYIPHATSNVAQLMTSLSRVSRDMIEWATYEFGFVEISDSYATVSSIMPQKKNPVVLEKTRTEASNTIGAANSALVHLKSAPYGDVREVAKYAFLPLFDTVDEVIRSLVLLAGMLETITVHEERMLTDARTSFSTMTELTDTLVRECDLSFRQAHHIVGVVVRIAFEQGMTADEITSADVDAAAVEVLGNPVELSSAELQDALDPETNVSRCNVIGGTAPRLTRKDRAAQQESLATQRSWSDEARSNLDEAGNLRDDRTEALRQ